MSDVSSVRRSGLIVISSLVAFIAAGAIWAALVPRSREVQTELGPMPLSPQDEVRVTGVVWLAIILAVLGLIVALVWWYLGPQRGPVALAVLLALCAFGGGAALLAFDLVVRIRSGSPDLVLDDTYDLLFAANWAPTVISPAIIAVTAYTVLSIGSRSNDLARDGEPSGGRSPEGRPVVGLSRANEPTHHRPAAPLDGR